MLIININPPKLTLWLFSSVRTRPKERLSGGQEVGDEYE